MNSEAGNVEIFLSASYLVELQRAIKVKVLISERKISLIIEYTNQNAVKFTALLH